MGLNIGSQATNRHRISMDARRSTAPGVCGAAMALRDPRGRVSRAKVAIVCTTDRAREGHRLGPVAGGDGAERLALEHLKTCIGPTSGLQAPPRIQ